MVIKAMQQRKSFTPALDSLPTLKEAQKSLITKKFDESNFDQWFANAIQSAVTELKQYPPSINKKQADTAAKEQSTQLTPEVVIGLYGLKSPQEVVAFLNSPTGKSIKALILHKLNEIEVSKKLQQQLIMEEHLRKHNSLMFLLLGLMVKEAKAEQIRHTEMSDPLLETQLNENNAAKELPPTVRELDERYKAYNISTQQIELELDLLFEMAKGLENEIVQAAKYEQDLSMRYKIVNEAVNKIENDINDIQNLADPDAQIVALKEKNEQLNNKSEKRLNKINKLITEGKKEEAQVKLLKQNALNLQLIGIRDMVSVLKGEKIFCDVDGKPVSHFKDAVFILSKEQRIVKDPDGKYYLLKPGEDFGSMTVEEKEAAKKNYDREYNNIMGVKFQVLRNQSIEVAEHEKNCQNIVNKSVNMQSNIMLLNNQLNQIHAEQAKITTLKESLLSSNSKNEQDDSSLSQSKPQEAYNQSPIPSPTPASAPVLKKEKEALTSKANIPAANTMMASKVYKHILALMHVTNDARINLDKLDNSQVSKMALTAMQNDTATSCPILDGKLRNNSLVNLENTTNQLNGPRHEVKIGMKKV